MTPSSFLSLASLMLNESCLRLFVSLRDKTGYMGETTILWGLTAGRIVLGNQALHDIAIHLDQRIDGEIFQ